MYQTEELGALNIVRLSVRLESILWVSKTALKQEFNTPHSKLDINFVPSHLAGEIMSPISL